MLFQTHFKPCTIVFLSITCLDSKCIFLIIAFVNVALLKGCHILKSSSIYSNPCKAATLLMKFGQFMSYYKRKNFIKKFCKYCNLKTSSRPFCVCKELSATSIEKWNFWSKLLILGYVIAKLSKFVKISMLTSLHSLLQRILWKLKRAWN